MLKDVVVRVHVSDRHASATPPSCQKCEKELDLHQPNPYCPEEMLGICPQCGEWHFVRSSDTGGSLVVARLPLHELEGAPPASPRRRAAELTPRAAVEISARL